MEKDEFIKRLSRVVKEWDSGERDAERAMEIVSCLLRELKPQDETSR